jgi:siroheme synthase-like protein
MRYYPIHLDLKGRQVLVVGGGTVAEGKVRQLISAGARVRLVSPTIEGTFERLISEALIEHRPRGFVEADLEGASLVISATDDSDVNETVSRAARRRRIWCNVVDRPRLCDFITPALVVRGELQISVSTGGGSPTLAQRVKREIAALIGDEYGELLEIATGMRAEAKESVKDSERRTELLRAFVESDAINLLREGRGEDARRLAHQLLKGQYDRRPYRADVD